MSELLEIPKC
jgi:hypothetical protein